jgi:hypothetical protein
VRYIPDNTGRFSHRPYYEPGELDRECERIIADFMQERTGSLTFPIPTDVLTKLIERDTDDLDLYANLLDEGSDVEGVTDFYPGERPKVRISIDLTESERRGHRYRTTLAHEYGHVHFHTSLFDALSLSPRMFPELDRAQVQKCQRATIISAQKIDWMEWQAGYVCGALLMPLTAFSQVVVAFRQRHNLHSLHVRSLEAGELLATIAEQFDVSEDAARVRLMQLNYMTSEPQVRPAF